MPNSNDTIKKKSPTRVKQERTRTEISSENGTADEFVRPIEPFSVAKQTAVRALAKALEERWFSADGAMAVAQAVADPSAVRRQLQAPEEVKVFGGTLLTVSTRISALALVVHVTNGRVVGATPYPASDSTSDGSAKFWPERDLKTNPDGASELLLEAGSRERMTDALELADIELAAHNSWEASIRANGVFAPVTVAAMTVATTKDSSAVLTAVDGSSRVASCHRILEIAPTDPLYGSLANPRNARGRLQELMNVLVRPRQDVNVEELERARAATLPATIVIGFRPDRSDGASLVDALDEYVALLHLEPPTPWAVPARENKVADAVIDSLRDVGEIDEERAAWFAGMVSPGDAIAAGFTAHADERAVEIFHTLSEPADTPCGKAVGVGIKRLSLQERASRTPKAQAAASLALRSYATANINRRRVATTLLQRVFLLEDFWRKDWEVTHRDPDEILEAALKDLDEDEVGASTLELGALAAYHLTVAGALGAEEAGSEASDGTQRRPADKREPRRVLGAMLSSEQGLYALHRAIVDGRKGEAPLQVDEEGEVALTVNDEPVGPMTNFWLRGTFRPRATKGTKPTAPAPTPLQRLNSAFAVLRTRIESVEEAITIVEGVQGKDGTPLIDQEGMDPVMVSELRSKLDDAMDRLSAYRAAWQLRHPRPSSSEPTDDERDSDEGED